MTDCLFCKIIGKEIPAQIVYEDAHALGFLDIHPRALGHTMMVPKIHAENILDLPHNAVAPLFTAVKKMAAALQNALTPDGFTIGVNQGNASGQEVNHLHIHLIPRWHGDGGSSIHSVVHNPPAESLADSAEKIKKAQHTKGV